MPSNKKLSNKDRAKLLRSAASALEHGRLATARKKIKQVCGKQHMGIIYLTPVRE